MTQSEKGALLDVSTGGLAGQDQFACFREAICPVYAVIVPGPFTDRSRMRGDVPSSVEIGEAVAARDDLRSLGTLIKSTVV